MSWMLGHCDPLRGVLGALVALALSSSVQAEAYDSANSALLAISFNRGRLTAGMMCNPVDPDSFGKLRDLPSCRKSEAPSGAICRLSNSSILNHDVLAFDVTTWSRQEIAQLATRVLQSDDPLNYDFSRLDLAGRHVRRIDENQDEDDLQPPAFEFNSGCYLLMKVPAWESVSGT
jgi:hypothetical protein